MSSDRDNKDGDESANKDAPTNPSTSTTIPQSSLVDPSSDIGSGPPMSEGAPSQNTSYGLKIEGNVPHYPNASIGSSGAQSGASRHQIGRSDLDPIANQL